MNDNYDIHAGLTCGSLLVNDGFKEENVLHFRSVPPPHRRHLARSLPVPRGRMHTGGFRSRLALSGTTKIINKNHTTPKHREHKTHSRIFESIKSILRASSGRRLFGETVITALCFWLITKLEAIFILKPEHVFQDRMKTARWVSSPRNDDSCVAVPTHVIIPLYHPRLRGLGRNESVYIYRNITCALIFNISGWNNESCRWLWKTNKHYFTWKIKKLMQFFPPKKKRSV